MKGYWREKEKRFPKISYVEQQKNRTLTECLEEENKQGGN